jgi:hypothetical protein
MGYAGIPDSLIYAGIVGALLTAAFSRQELAMSPPTNPWPWPRRRDQALG